MATYLWSHKPTKLDKRHMRGTAREVRVNSKTAFSDELLHMDVLMLADQQELTSVLYEHWMQSRGPTWSNGW